MIRELFLELEKQFLSLIIQAAFDLYHAGTKDGSGILSRQYGESMNSYYPRRDWVKWMTRFNATMRSLENRYYNLERIPPFYECIHFVS